MCSYVDGLMATAVLVGPVGLAAAVGGGAIYHCCYCCSVYTAEADYNGQQELFQFFCVPGASQQEVSRKITSPLLAHLQGEIDRQTEVAAETATSTTTAATECTLECCSAV